jgi:hypothetical protein
MIERGAAAGDPEAHRVLAGMHADGHAEAGLPRNASAVRAASE